jgi:hypothetical protein
MRYAVTPRPATYRGITFATTAEAARAVALTAWGSAGTTSRAAWPKRAAKASSPSGGRTSPPSTGLAGTGCPDATATFRPFVTAP